MFYRLLVAIFAAALLSGCITAESPGLSVDAVARFRLTDVTVDFTPNATIHYSDAEDDAANAQVASGAVQPGGRLDAEKVRAYELERTKSVIEKAFLTELGPKLAGSEPVKVRVTVSYFWVPGPLATVLVGGGANLTAGVELLDAKSGNLIVGFDPSKGAGAAPGGGGIGGLLINSALYSASVDGKAGQMARGFADEFANWLLQRK